MPFTKSDENENQVSKTESRISYEKALVDFVEKGGEIKACPPRKAAGHAVIPNEKLLPKHRPRPKRKFPARKKKPENESG